MRAKRVVKRAGEEAKDGGAEKDHKNGHVLPRGRLVVCKVHTREADQQHREYHRAGEVTVDVDCQEALEGILATDSVSYGLTGLVMQVWRYHSVSPSRPRAEHCTAKCAPVRTAKNGSSACTPGCRRTVTRVSNNSPGRTPSLSLKRVI